MALAGCPDSDLCHPYYQVWVSVDVCVWQAPLVEGHSTDVVHDLEPFHDSRVTRCSAGPLTHPAEPRSRHVPHGPRSALGERLAVSPSDRDTLSPDIVTVARTCLR